MTQSDPIEALCLRPGDAALLVIDYQERLFSAMPEGAREKHLANLCVLLQAARRLDLPVVATEQYPKGIGPTLTQVREIYPDLSPLEKMEFSCCRNEAAARALARTGPRTLLVAGMETHICVYQSVLDLRERGREVQVVADACLSRARANWERGLSLCEKAGATVTTTETALFQLLGRAGTAEFKELSRLIR